MLSAFECSESIIQSRKLVETIVRRFPDYGKVTPQYVAGLIEVMATFPLAVQTEIADIREGISGIAKFLPTVADLVEFGKQIDTKHEAAERYRQPRREIDTSEYIPKQIPQYFDRHGERITEREANERAEAHRQAMAGMKRVNRMLAYVKQLGDGDALKGWEIAIANGESEPPAEWTP